jgi:hypothetical protein
LLHIFYPIRPRNAFSTDLRPFHNTEPTTFLLTCNRSCRTSIKTKTASGKVATKQGVTLLHPTISGQNSPEYRHKNTPLFRSVYQSIKTKGYVNFKMTGLYNRILSFLPFIISSISGIDSSAYLCITAFATT